MTLVILQERFLGFAALVYLFATICYIVYLGKRSEAVGKAATIFGLAGAIIHTLGLAFRWMAAGFDHPPFTNLYESLVFFAWGIVVFYLWIEWRNKIRMAGAFVFPVALAAMGIAVTHQDKGIMPLPDALKSWWLHIHVMFASIAYAAFVVAFAFSLMYLIKDKIKREWFGAITSAFTALVLLAIMLRNGFENITNFVMKQVVLMDGKMVPKVMMSPEGVKEYSYQVIPGVGPLVVIALALLVVATFFYIMRILNENDTFIKAAGGALAISTAIQTLAIAKLMYYSSTMTNVSIKGDIFLVLLLFLMWFMCGGMLMLHYLNEELTERLPDVDKLDFLSYRSVVVAFPLMTIVIVTGAVWAQSAWGRYWSWDPKETASLVTWFVYAIYLHSRIVAGWKGRPTAIISIIGFLSVIFTYLGVNIFLSGLHSYGGMN